MGAANNSKKILSLSQTIDPYLLDQLSHLTTQQNDKLYQCTDYYLVKKSIISPPSCADESDYSYDTLGLHYADEPQTGGILPDATKSVGSISAITTPLHFIPTPQIHIPDNSLIGSSRSGAALASIVDVSTASRSAGTSSGGSSSSKQLGIKERKQLAKENLAAGLLAMKITDFDTAVEFFARGRKYLGGWDVDFKLMLRLCSEEANACFITGDYDAMNVHINEIISKDIPITDKFKAYETKILYQQEALQNYQESLDICIDVRKQLGMQGIKNKPQSNLKIVFDFIKTNRALGKKTAEELADLPNLTDERLLMGQRMLGLMGNASFSVQPTLFPGITCLAFREALKHGIGTSPVAIAGFGIILCSFQNPKRGRELARAAELIILSRQPDMEQSKAKTIYLCEGLINHWILPIRDSLGPLLDGYNTGLKHGNLQDASLNQCFYVAHAYFAGMPLKEDVLNETSPLQTFNDIETFAGDSKGDSRLDTHLANRIDSLVSANLRGDTLEGMNFDGILKYCADTGNRTLRGYVFVAQYELKVFFGEWLEAAELLTEAGELLPEMVGMYQGVRYIFVCTLVYIKTAQSSSGLMKRKKFKKKALKKMKVIRGFVKKGHVSCVHNLHLLEAELTILDRNVKQVDDFYKLAIDVASKGGFLHDKALSHELASMYFAKKGDEYWRDYHMENAINSYTEWGATAKVEKLTH